MKMLHSKILICFLAINLINISYVDSQANISLSVDISPKYSIVSAGDDVIMQINLMQSGGQSRKDVIVAVSLFDSSNQGILKSTETVALETRASLVSELSIPENTKSGIYNVKVEIFDVNEKDLFAKTSKEITVKNKITAKDIYFVGSLLIIIAFIIFIIILYKHNRDLQRSHKQKITKQNIRNYLRRKE